MKCPQCGAGKPHWGIGATKCGKCGYEPVVKAKACPKCGAKEPTWNAVTGR